MKRPTILLLMALTFPATAGGTNWPEVLQGVAAGETRWLGKVPALAAIADVKQAQELEDALSLALTANTVEVLNTLSVIDARQWPHMIGTDIVCGVPVEKSSAVLEDFYQRTRLALLSTDKGATCLWFLEATYEEWKTENSRNIR